MTRMAAQRMTAPGRATVPSGTRRSLGLLVATPFMPAIRPLVTLHSKSLDSNHAAVICGGARRHSISVRAEAVSGDSNIAAATALPVQKLTLKAAGTEITLETGEIGRQANGSVLLTCGGTVLYSTACCAKSPTGDGSFVPLTIDYQERFSAAGRTSGGFLKREGRPRDADTLVARLVDRPLRPMFAKGWAVETQVLEYVLSYDSIHAPEPLAIIAASAALLISDIPMTKAVAAVRVGWLPGPGGGASVVNPTVQQMEKSRLDLVMAGTRDAVMMIEGYCNFLTEEQMLQAVSAGSAAISSMCLSMEEWASLVGKPKAAHLAQLTLAPPGLAAAVQELVADQLMAAFRAVGTKDAFSEAVEEARLRVLAALGGPDSVYTPSQLLMALKDVESELLRKSVLTTGRRTDGRGVRDVRPIQCRAGVLPRVHGSALFTRGQTQALCVTTLGSSDDAQKVDSIRSSGRDDVKEQRFYLQYSFPPSSVGEVRRTGAPGRRELGHGELAQRALMPIVPDAGVKDWPYTMRVESMITESNGSSSMASVCGGCLALQDAGVPISRPVAGIAMGLILEEDGQFCVLTDILGSEDALGDMDFKVAGDADSITAFQMDIKVEGITLPVLAQALAQAKEGRRHILQEMTKCSPAPRKQLSEFAPFLHTAQVDPTKRGAVIGVGGRTVKQICALSGATSIDFNDEGELEIMAPNRAAGEAAMAYINLVLEDPPVGQVFRKCKVTGIQAFGAFVEIAPGRQGLVHVSELDVTLVTEVGNVVKLNQEIDVMVLDCSNGKLSLSRKSVLLADNGIPRVPSPARQPVAETARERDNNERGPGRWQSASVGGRGGASGAGGARRQVSSSPRQSR